MSNSASATPIAEPMEEIVDDQGTGVEVEDTDSQTHDPWNPEEISIRTNTYSLRQTMDMIDDKDIDLAPDFQRQYVWKAPQQSGLIESLLLGIPLPSFYFNADRDGRYQVVDGVQRLTTIHRFCKGKFSLGSLAYLVELKGMRFPDLDGSSKRRLRNTQFVAHVIEPQTPYRVKFDVFKRINTGGSPLSAQEIRHCMSKDQSRSFLKEITQLDSFARVMGRAVMNNSRMADREIALRLIAFHVTPLEDYRDFESLDAFLGHVTEQLDTTLDPKRRNRLVKLADQALMNAERVFGQYAFRKWPHNSDRVNPINRTLVESWGTALARCNPDAVQRSAHELQRRARDLMTTSEAFIDSITGGTGDAGKVNARMTLVAQAVKETIG